MRNALSIILLFLLASIVNAGIRPIFSPTSCTKHIHKPSNTNFIDCHKTKKHVEVSATVGNVVLLKDSLTLVDFRANHVFFNGHKCFEDNTNKGIWEFSSQSLLPIPKIRKVRTIHSRKNPRPDSNVDRKVIKISKNRNTVSKPETKIEFPKPVQINKRLNNVLAHNTFTASRPGPKSISTKLKYSGRRNNQLLGNKVKTLEQLTAYDKWETRIVNKGGENNCYYCVAAGLAGLDTDQMVRASEAMQDNGGTVEDTLSLLKSVGYSNSRAVEFSDFRSMKQYLYEQVQPGTAKRFGLAYHWGPVIPNGISGHMVGIKVWKTMDGLVDGRVVDFQQEPENRFKTFPNLNDRPGPFTIIEVEGAFRPDKDNIPKRFIHGGDKRPRIPGSGA